MVYNIIVASHTEATPEVVDFKNIGCGQYHWNIAVTIEITFQLIRYELAINILVHRVSREICNENVQ